MNKVILQVPMSKELKLAGQKAAQEQGFSSLQEFVRVFLTKFAKHEVSLAVQEEAEYLTPAQAKRVDKKYQQFLKDKKAGKTFTAHSVEELMEQLTS